MDTWLQKGRDGIDGMRNGIHLNPTYELRLLKPVARPLYMDREVMRQQLASK